MSEPFVYELGVSKVIRETPDACSVVFDIPADARDVFGYRAGQFVTVRVDVKGETLARCYSLSSTPEVDSHHKITIKRVEGGKVSNWINDHVKAGDRMTVLPPGGRFVLDSSERPLCMFAGGSGITPVISIIKSALFTTSRPIRLIYANRDAESVIFDQGLRQLVERYEGQLSLVHSLDSEDGFLTADRVSELVGDLNEAEFYMCGPEPFMNTVEAALASIGVAEERVHIERFVFQEATEADIDETVARASEEGEAPNSITIHLDGTVHEVPYEEGSTVLFSAQKAGLQPPFSCTDGFCGCCMAKLEGGEVRMLNNEFLSPKELEQGWVLTCQSVPIKGGCILKYPE